MSSYFEYVVSMLDLFDGQLSIDDIENKSYRELAFLKYWKEKSIEAHENIPSMRQLNKIAKKL